jgi:phosphoglycerol transferase MdoB-like AlkP superfamily enzyme
MNEALAYSFQSINVFPTILLLITVLYWVAVILGALDVGFLDFDLDPDFETDVNVEIDVGTEVGGEPGGGFAESFLSFFNLGRVPVMVVFSFFSISFWLVAINVNYYLTIQTLWLAALIYLPVIFGSMLVAKFCTIPLLPVFGALNKEGQSKQDLVGTLGITVLPLSIGKLGQVKLIKNEETFVIKVKTFFQDKIDKGTQVIVIEYKEQDRFYIVEPFEYKD